MRRFNIILALVITMLVVPPCQGSHAAQPDYLSVFSTAARTYFAGGELPACGQPKFGWLPSTEVEKHLGFWAMGYGNADACLIVFNKDWWDHTTPDLKCMVVVHEWGHIYGRGHEKEGVMSDPLWDWRETDPCRGLLRPVSYWDHHGQWHATARLRKPKFYVASRG